MALLEIVPLETTVLGIKVLEEKILEIEMLEIEVLAVRALETGTHAQAAEIPKTDIADKQTEEIKEGSVQV